MRKKTAGVEKVKMSDVMQPQPREHAGTRAARDLQKLVSVTPEVGHVCAKEALTLKEVLLCGGPDIDFDVPDRSRHYLDF